MRDYKKMLMGSSTLPFSAGGPAGFTLGHHHHHHADGSCCGPAHDGDEAAEEEAVSLCAPITHPANAAKANAIKN